MIADCAEHAGSTVVCPRYENVYEYARNIGRPLTSLEQRAFLHLLDLDGDERYVHGPECVCMDILPAVIQALDPDPVECVVVERTLEGESYKSQRFHTEKVGKFQGIVLGLKTQREHTGELKKLATRLLGDFATVMKELKARMPMMGYQSEQAMIDQEFPAIRQFAPPKVRPSRRPAPILISDTLPTRTSMKEVLHSLRKRLDEQYEADKKKIDQAEAILDGFTLLQHEPVVKKTAAKTTKKKPAQTASEPRVGSVRQQVLDAIKADWASVTKIEEQTGLSSSKIREVLNANDLKDRIENRNAADGLLEYRLKPA